MRNIDTWYMKFLHIYRSQRRGKTEYEYLDSFQVDKLALMKLLFWAQLFKTNDVVS